MTDTNSGTDAGLQLIVLSGFHAGARCHLPYGACSVGSDAADAVVLGDPGVVPGHLILDVRDTSVSVRTSHEGAALDGVDLPPGEPIVAALPFELALAGVVLRCDMGGDASDDVDEAVAGDVPRPPFLSRFRPTSRSALHVPALACAVVALGVLLPGIPTATSVPLAGGIASQVAAAPPAATLVANAAVAPAPQPGDPATPGGRDAAPGRSGLAMALQELRLELSARSLSGIQLTAGGGAITARGRLDPGREADWRLTQQWFDGRHGRYGHEASLIDEVRFVAAPAAAAVAVDAVWTGRNPNVVIKGQRFFEGATLPSGFRLERVSPGELLVEREGQRQVLKF